MCAALLIDLISLCDLSQLGDGFSPTSQNTPVSVVGLSSGVSLISRGEVRLSFVRGSEAVLQRLF